MRELLRRKRCGQGHSVLLFSANEISHTTIKGSETEMPVGQRSALVTN